MGRTRAARSTRVPDRVLAVGAVAVFLIVAAWLTHGTWQNLYPSRQDIGTLTDFRDAIYYPLRALFDGVNPYDPSAYYAHYPVGQEFPTYTPLHLVVHSPLLLLSFPAARATYYAISIGLLLVLSWFTLRIAGYRTTITHVFGLGTLLLLTDPTKFTLRAGQPTILVILGVYLALASDDDHRPLGVAGVLLAFTKPTYGAALLIVMLARRQTRAALTGFGLAVIASALVAIPLASAAGSLGKLIDSLRTDLDVTSRSPQSQLGSPLRIDAANTLARLTGRRPSEAVAVLAGTAFLVAGVYAIWRLRSAKPASNRSELSATLACLVIVLCVFHVSYDLVILTWPIVLLVRRHPPDTTMCSERIRTMVLVLLLVPVVDPLSWTVVNDTLGRVPAMKTLLGPTASGLYLIAAFVLCLCAAWLTVRYDGGRSIERSRDSSGAST